MAHLRVSVVGFACASGKVAPRQASFKPANFDEVRFAARAH
jgi:hypothetical protein